MIVLKDEPSFNALIKKDLHQVFLLCSPSSIPVNFVIHPWFVINRRGIVSKWEVGFGLHRREKSWGHLDLDLHRPHQGVHMFAFSNTFLWKARLISSVEGTEGSLAARMADFIARSDKTYPYPYKYSLIGPNSNSYAQWVLDHFPESGMKLPWNSLGKWATPDQ